ncbi:unnamed protein product, partial [Allacma fusca]
GLRSHFHSLYLADTPIVRRALASGFGVAKALLVPYEIETSDEDHLDAEVEKNNAEYKIVNELETVVTQLNELKRSRVEQMKTLQSANNSLFLELERIPGDAFEREAAGSNPTQLSSRNIVKFQELRSRLETEIQRNEASADVTDLWMRLKLQTHYCESMQNKLAGSRPSVLTQELERCDESRDETTAFEIAN